MKWIYLFIAGALEITWAVTMKMSNGFTLLIPSIITGIGYIASAVFLSIALKQLPPGTAWHACQSHHTRKKTAGTGRVSCTNDASRLQKWHLAYKTGVSFTNMQFSIYKQASRLTNWNLGLQLSQLSTLYCKKQ